MKKYTFSLSKLGYEVTDPDPNHKLLDADYPFLKFHDDLTDTVTLVPGDTEKYVDFAHTLGYTPAFIAYNETLDGKQKFVPSIPWGVGFTSHPYAYADSSKIRCGYAIDIGAYNQFSDNYQNLWTNGGGLDTNGWFTVGKDDVGSTYNGALRFIGVSIPQGSTINSAILGIAVDGKGSGAGDLKAKIYGIDEDNTSDFSSNPLGRDKTTAYDEANWSLPTVGEYSNHSIISVVQEIINRANWASGNAMGFIINDNGSPDDVYVYDQLNVGISSTLTINYGSNITLTFRVIIFKDKIA